MHMRQEVQTDAPRRGVDVRTIRQRTSFPAQCTTFTLIHVRRDQARQPKEWSRRAGQTSRADTTTRSSSRRACASFATVVTRMGVKLVYLTHPPSTITTTTTIMSSTSSAAAASASRRRESVKDGEYGGVAIRKMLAVPPPRTAQRSCL